MSDRPDAQPIRPCQPRQHLLISGAQSTFYLRQLLIHAFAKPQWLRCMHLPCRPRATLASNRSIRLKAQRTRHIAGSWLRYVQVPSTRSNLHQAGKQVLSSQTIALSADRATYCLLFLRSNLVTEATSIAIESSSRSALRSSPSTTLRPGATCSGKQAAGNGSPVAQPPEAKVATNRSTNLIVTPSISLIYRSDAASDTTRCTGDNKYSSTVLFPCRSPPTIASPQRVVIPHRRWRAVGSTIRQSL